MAWIESHQDLAHHPKVARLAGTLEVSVPAAIGHLHCLWWWCLSYADDGDLTDFSDFEIGYAAQWRGEPDVFVEALQKSGWLDGREVHDWHEYGGKLAERRRQDAERKRKARAKTSTGRPPDSPQDDRADGVRREQNTTEDNNTPTPLDPPSDEHSVLGVDMQAEILEHSQAFRMLRKRRRWPDYAAVLEQWSELGAKPLASAVDVFASLVSDGYADTPNLLRTACEKVSMHGSPKSEDVPDWLEDHWKQGGTDE